MFGFLRVQGFWVLSVSVVRGSRGRRATSGSRLCSACELVVYLGVDAGPRVQGLTPVLTANVDPLLDKYAPWP